MIYHHRLVSILIRHFGVLLAKQPVSDVMVHYKLNFYYCSLLLLIDLVAHGEPTSRHARRKVNAELTLRTNIALK
jgi:hypothetical protein